MKKNLPLITLILLAIGNSAFAQNSNQLLKPKPLVSKAPKLVVVLVIDQFRADYLTRFQSRFKQDGFNQLIKNGAYYPFAEYDILQSMTCPGHATLLTGSYPYLSGIPLNKWYDTEKQKQVYCVENKDPSSLTTTTVGDELKNAGFQSKVISIALKDRSAIMMGGHRADLALWFEPKINGWTTSDHYGKTPTWALNLNQDIAKQKGQSFIWNLADLGTGLSLPLDAPKGPGESELRREFKIGEPETLATPYGLQITTRAAKQALKEYSLGQGRDTDILAVSFSSHDYLGHAYGPNHRFMEEMTVAEDEFIAELLNEIKRTVPGGLKDVVVVLTGDHGAPPNPDWLNSEKHPGGRVDQLTLKKNLEEYLSEKIGSPPSDKSGEAKWVQDIEDLNIYLTKASLTNKKTDRQKLEQEVKNFLNKQEGILTSFSDGDYKNKKIAVGPMLERQIYKTYISGKSGDVVGILKPFFMTAAKGVDHVTSYQYDRTVPLILSGPSFFKVAKFPDRAEIVDIAPTLAYLLHVLAPATNEGHILKEALKNN